MLYFILWTNIHHPYKGTYKLFICIYNNEFISRTQSQSSCLFTQQENTDNTENTPKHICSISAIKLLFYTTRECRWHREHTKAHLFNQCNQVVHLHNKRILITQRILSTYKFSDIQSHLSHEHTKIYTLSLQNYFQSNTINTRSSRMHSWKFVSISGSKKLFYLCK